MNPISLKPKDGQKGRNVPCGQCPECFMTRRSSWVFRICQEWKQAYSACFLTLTYSDEHVPVMLLDYKKHQSYIEKYEDYVYLPLVKKDLQDYFKRVRVDSPNLRYYAVGEYGSKNKRPHYHAIVFNADTRSLEKSWTVNGQEKGFYEIDECNGSTISYTTKYILDSDRYEQPVKPFAIMSKGLGKCYLTEDVKKFYSTLLDGKVRCEGGANITMPRYYKDKIFNKDELEYIGKVNLYIANEIYQKKGHDRWMMNNKCKRLTYKEKSKSSKV